MKNRVKSVLGGKAATEMVFGVVDTGANSDIRRAFDIAERLVDNYCAYGFDSWEKSMNASLAVVERKEMRIYAELEQAYNAVKKMLAENRGYLDAIAGALMKKEILTSSDIAGIKLQSVN